MTTLIDQIKLRASDPSTATDEDSGKTPPGSPATEAQIRDAEQQLGFLLPPLLRKIYGSVGNGGFGPGAGIFDLATLVKNYTERRHPKTGRSWPVQLLPICEWGANIETSLDCTDVDVPVIRHDPNMPKADVNDRVPTSKHYAKASVVKEACWIESMTFEKWMTDWAEGKRLFYAAYSTDDEDVDDLVDEDEEDEE